LKLDSLNCYKTYLAIKNHFTNKNYDYYKYCGKVKANIKSFYNRKDRFYFEKMSRQKNDEEIINFFMSNFVSCDDPQSLWVGQIIKDGEETYRNWMRKIQSLSYLFKEEVCNILSSENFDDMFLVEINKHPKILKSHLQKKISLETLVILNSILDYKKQFDKKLNDPVWEFTSMRIEKYTPFLHIDKTKFTKILKECIL
jgi:hypothetical protein